MSKLPISFTAADEALSVLGVQRSDLRDIWIDVTSKNSKGEFDSSFFNCKIAVFGFATETVIFTSAHLRMMIC